MTGSGILFSRRNLILGTAALAFGCVTRPSGNQTRQVLFVCEHGSVKSPVAREHFRRIAARRGLAVHALSRGISPSEDVSPRLAAALAVDGIDPRREPLTRLTRADLTAADVIAAFNPLPAELTAGLTLDLRYWFDVPAMNEDYAAARASLLAHLEALAGELAGGRIA